MGTLQRMDIVATLTQTGRSAVSLYRRTGADVPFGDPLPSHGTEMEGWFWRLTDPEAGRVVVALCSANRHPDGDWATAAIALHPGGVVRSAAVDTVTADRNHFAVQGRSGTDCLNATTDRLEMEIGDCAVDLTFRDEHRWPKAFGGGGVFSSVPFLNQYWHPYRLGGRASGTARRIAIHASNTSGLSLYVWLKLANTNASAGRPSAARGGVSPIGRLRSLTWYVSGRIASASA